MALEIFEQAAALADHFEQAFSGMTIFLMGLQVFGEAVDPVGQERHLNRRGTGVRLVLPKLLNHGSFLSFPHHVTHPFCSCSLFSVNVVVYALVVNGSSLSCAEHELRSLVVRQV